MGVRTCRYYESGLVAVWKADGLVQAGCGHGYRGSPRIATIRRMTTLKWLLDSDPAIRWQVLRDIVNESQEVVAAERTRITNEGWGARLLTLQGEDGRWAGGACFPGGGSPCKTKATDSRGFRHFRACSYCAISEWIQTPIGFAMRSQG